MEPHTGMPETGTAGIGGAGATALTAPSGPDCPACGEAIQAAWMQLRRGCRPCGVRYAPAFRCDACKLVFLHGESGEYRESEKTSQGAKAGFELLAEALEAGREIPNT